MSFKTSMLFLLSILSISGVVYILQYKSHLTINTIEQTNLTKEELSKNMAAQVDSWTDALGKPVDPKIKDTVIVLNLLGFKTSQSCEGHIDCRNFYPWVSFSAEEDSDIEALTKQRMDIANTINKEEQKIREKYPKSALSEINVESEAPELVLSWRQMNEIGDQIERLSRMKFI